MLDWTGEVRRWIGAAPERGSDDPLNTWAAFAAERTPVVTLFGAYDSGKSSLLRRLLIDAGVPVPDWLTISARHETFEAQSVSALGCQIQDTPGIVLNPIDARAKQNTAQALRAATLTDVLIIVLTPQLPTAELPAIRAIAEDRWCNGSLWFVISRFDEAGIDPEGDPSGYRNLAERKARELGAVLESELQPRIFVVSQDFAQLAGDDPDPDPDTWDDSRDWDGMDELAAAVTSLPDRPLEDLRNDAELRFWHAALTERIDNTRQQLTRQQFARDASREVTERRESWLGQLDVLSEAARTSLDAELRETARSLLSGKSLDHSRIKQEVEQTIELWITMQDQQLNRLVQDMEVTWDRLQDRPGYRVFEEFLSDLGGLPSDQPDVDQEPDFPRYTEKVDQLLGTLEPILSEIMESRRRDTPSGRFARPRKSGSGSKSAGVDPVQVLAIARPLITQVAGMVEEEMLMRKQRDLEQARQQKLRKAIDGVSERAAKLVSDAWDQHVADLKAEIDRRTAEHSALLPELDKITREMNDALQTGQAILDRYPSCADD